MPSMTCPKTEYLPAEWWQWYQREVSDQQAPTIPNVSQSQPKELQGMHGTSRPSPRLAVQVRLRPVGDEELAAVGVGTC